MLSFEVLGQTIVNGIAAASIYMMISLGLALVFGVMRVVNLAQGEFMMLAAFGSFWLFTLYGVDPYLSMVAMIPASLLLGYAVYRLIIRRLLGADDINQFLATFGLALMLQGIAQYLWSADLRRLPYVLPSLEVGDVTLAGVRVVNIGVCLAVLAFLAWFLGWTGIGRSVRATASNRMGAMLCGVDVRRVDATTFLLGTAISAVGGTMLALVYFVYPSVGAGLIFKGFAVVILGGMGSIAGVIVGSLVLGITEAMVNVYVSSQLSALVAFAVIFIVLVSRPQGLFGTAR
ncbi:MAG: branched-chain amino acid ABC transporter permease [Alphaproteobacteria bacterium]|nr:branched-chain amino acid ABC transporter permease [Alphaproteobacteria bacterium]